MVIAVLTAGLGYLRFASDASVSVPAGAKAGDLIVKSCSYSTEKGSFAADCGTLVVPGGRFGHVSRALLRSLYPIVLGLGGWFLAALVVITTGAGVPLDSQAMGIVSIGIPVGLGIYWAWLKRDSRTTTKVAGLSAAVLGALAGGWFGFGALTGLGAILTTTVGAAAGANLALIGFDLSRVRELGRLQMPRAHRRHDRRTVNQ